MYLQFQSYFVFRNNDNMITMNLGVTNTIEIVSTAGEKEMLPGASVLEIGPFKIQAKCGFQLQSDKTVQRSEAC